MESRLVTLKRTTKLEKVHWRSYTDDPCLRPDAEGTEEDGDQVRSGT